jgi:hypothetical protein
MERLKQRGADLVYRCGKGHTEPLQSDKYAGELVLTPLDLIDRAREPGEGVDAMPDWDLANQSPPDYPDDQRTTW